ncbi:hypothetical protein [Mongoliitalea lutea]|nr:hypothetical protein [Mongoliitalea lutea]
MRTIIELLDIESFSSLISTLLIIGGSCYLAYATIKYRASKNQNL